MSKSALSGALVANAFFRAGYIEAWGRGIEKIHRECREHDIPLPVFDYGMSGLMLTFRANMQHLLAIWGERGVKRLLGEKVGEKVGEALTSNQRQIFTLLRENPRMAAREVAQHVGISRCLFHKSGASATARKTSCPRRGASSPRGARPLDSRVRGNDATT